MKNRSLSLSWVRIELRPAQNVLFYTRAVRRSNGIETLGSVRIPPEDNRVLLHILTLHMNKEAELSFKFRRRQQF
jgi:hypothetical protein